MTQHFQAYVSNLNRVRLIELIEAMLLRHARARASLIFRKAGLFALIKY